MQIGRFPVEKGDIGGLHLVVSGAKAWTGVVVTHFTVTASPFDGCRLADLETLWPGRKGDIFRESRERKRRDQHHKPDQEHLAGGSWKWQKGKSRNCYFEFEGRSA